MEEGGEVGGEIERKEAWSKLRKRGGVLKIQEEELGRKKREGLEGPVGGASKGDRGRGEVRRVETVGRVTPE